MSKARLGWKAWAALVVLGVCLGGLVASHAEAARGSYVEVRVDGVVNPLKERHVKRALARAARENASFLLLTIDTPGGLVTSLLEITSALSNASLPVVGFVEPNSAQATSAGAFILLATDVAAMAPGTRVGAAHPVADGKALEGALDEKATNSLASLARSLAERRGRPSGPAEAMVRDSKSFTEKEARAAGLVEILAVNRAHLLRELQGRSLSFRGKPFTFETAGLSPIVFPLSRIDRWLDAIANPTLASLLISLGVLGILYELSSPGVGMGGVVGAICLLLGLLAISVLPIELGAVVLLMVGVSAIGLELKLPSHGLLAGGGVIALVLGGLFLVDADDYFGGATRVNAWIFAPLVFFAAGGLALLARLTRRALAAPFVSGERALVGKHGVAKTAFTPAGAEYVGSVFVDGARWQGFAQRAVAEGEPVVVTRIEHGPLRLGVERATKGE